MAVIKSLCNGRYLCKQKTKDYRERVLRELPNLTKLDNDEVTQS